MSYFKVDNELSKVFQVRTVFVLAVFRIDMRDQKL